MSEKDNQTGKKEYAQLATQRSLPSYEELDKEFSLDLDEGNVLEQVAKTIASKHDHFASVVENILHPDQTITAMHESQAFTDLQKETMLILLQKLMHTYREFTLCELERTGFDKYISRSWSEWSALKRELRIILSGLVASWTNTTALKVEIEYLG